MKEEIISWWKQFLEETKEDRKAPVDTLFGMSGYYKGQFHDFMDWLESQE